MLGQQQTIYTVLQQGLCAAQGNQFAVVMQHRSRVIALVFNVDKRRVDGDANPRFDTAETGIGLMIPLHWRAAVVP